MRPHSAPPCRSGSSRLPVRLLIVTVGLALIATACTDDRPIFTSAPEPTVLTVTALSTRADSVTGGDVLVGIDGTEITPEVTANAAIQNGVARFGNQWRVLVKGLEPGANTIEVRAGDRSATLEVIDHPKNGPVISGPHLPMPRCTTTDFGLAEATAPDCDAPTVVTFRYVDDSGEYHALDEPANLPDDVATATTTNGTVVPFVLRTETGVINRSIYTLTALDPTPGLTTWDGSAWNERLVYRYGGGCGTAYSQGFNLFRDPDPDVLEAGYAVATSTLTTFQVACNDVLSAETTMMVKEHFAEAWGLPQLTIGEGGSGGAIQQLMIAQNYPGLLDAITPTLPFPDAVSISGGVVDCALLNSFYATPTAAGWSTEQQIAVNGHLTTSTCTFWQQTFVPGIDPTKCGLGDGVGAVENAIPGLVNGLPTAPPELIYDPTSNPDGLRCTLQDSNVNIFGRDPDTGFARRPWDNVGLQYGLRALNSGEISVDQFLDLNESVGSFDIDGQPQAQRAAADEDVVRVAYETGRVNEGAGDLKRIPIILVNLYTDPQGDIHDRFRAFTIRERLRNDDGSEAPNAVIWTRSLPAGTGLLDSLSGAVSLGLQLISTADEWATAVKDDTSDRPVEAKLAEHRPELGVDACFDADGTVVESGQGLYESPGPCVDPYPLKGDPRTVAGQELRNDVIKCALLPTAETTYEVEFTDVQRQRLDAVFPDGVCDWSKPGVGQVPPGEPWRRYG